MNIYIKSTPKTKSLTGSRKREVRVSSGSSLINVDSYWSGGSRSDFSVLNIDTGLNILPQGNHPFGASGRLGYALRSGDILIETGTFCGKPATPTFHCRAEDEARVLEYLNKVTL